MLKTLQKSLLNAIRGITLAIKAEQSFRFQIAAAMFVMVTIFILPLSNVESALLLLAVGAILVLELLNSTVERMMDLFKPRLHPYVRDVKDMMAAAVLLASVFALVIGILLLGPYISLFVRL